MYEKFNGSSRLINALETAVKSPNMLHRLADCLYYCDDQLPQDVQAVRDVYEDLTARREAEH